MKTRNLLALMMVFAMMAGAVSNGFAAEAAKKHKSAKAKSKKTETASTTNTATKTN